MINVSAKTGAGIDELTAAIADLAGYQDQGEGAFTARSRHIVALQEARTHFNQGRDALEHEIGPASCWPKSSSLPSRHSARSPASSPVTICSAEFSPSFALASKA